MHQKTTLSNIRRRRGDMVGYSFQCPSSFKKSLVLKAPWFQNPVTMLNFLMCLNIVFQNYQAGSAGQTKPAHRLSRHQNNVLTTSELLDLLHFYDWEKWQPKIFWDRNYAKNQRHFQRLQMMKLDCLEIVICMYIWSFWHQIHNLIRKVRCLLNTFQGSWRCWNNC